MASRKAIHEENAEAAARVAVNDLSDANKERRQYEEGTTLEHEPQNEESGILRSILKPVGETYEQVKEAFASRNSDIDNSTGRRAGDDKDYMDQKTKQELEAIAEAIAGRMAEMKESAAVAARRARDFFTGKAGELDRETLEGGDMNEEKYGETEFRAREKMGELRLNEEGVYDEAKQRAAADWETAAERNCSKKNIYGAVGSVKEAIKDKLTYPTDVVQEARASREYGGPKRGEKLVDDIEGPSGPAALPTVKTSD